eukprot:6374350-Amphidinium_carterae.1
MRQLSLGNLGLRETSEMDPMPNILAHYVEVVLNRKMPYAATNLRTWRELRTLAAAGDALLAGRALQALDFITQRIKALELNLVQGSWSQARFLEVLAPEHVGAVGVPELQMAARAERTERNLHPELTARAERTERNLYPNQASQSSWWGLQALPSQAVATAATTTAAAPATSHQNPPQAAQDVAMEAYTNAHKGKSKGKGKPRRRSWTK